MKQHTIRLILLVACTLFAVCAYATEKDKGPESMMLHSTLDPARKPKPAFFPTRSTKSACTVPSATTARGLMANRYRT